MTIEGNCKINLSLNIEGILPNGYHSIRTIFQELSLSDRISMEFGESGVSLTCDKAGVPTDEKNIAYRAALLFYDAAGISDGVHIHIEKNIPSEAGLGGGSADGGAVLKGMNEHYGYPLSAEKLIELGAMLGADVPFFIMGGTALATGIGEVLTPLKSKIKTDVLIVKPSVGVSTPWAYKTLDEEGFTPADVDKTLLAIEKGDLDLLCSSMGNVFEQVVEKTYPQISHIKNQMLSLGARGSMMSGSGTAVFGIFDNADALNNAYDYFRNEYKETFKAKMI